MNITCPECKARYSVDDARVPPSGVSIRCPGCSHTFVARRPTGSDRAGGAVPLPGRRAATRDVAPGPSEPARGPVPLPGREAASPAARPSPPRVPAPQSGGEGAVPLPGRAASPPAGRATAAPSPTAKPKPKPRPTSDLDLSLDLDDDEVPDRGDGFGKGTLDFIDDVGSRAGPRAAAHKAPGGPELRVRHRNGRVDGPHGRERIKALLRAGDLSGSEDISEDGVSWRAMTSDAELNATINAIADAGDALAFGQVDLGVGVSESLDVGPPSGGGERASSADLDLGLGPDPMPPEAEMSGPPPMGASSSLDELMGSLDLDRPASPVPADRPASSSDFTPGQVRNPGELPDELEVGEIPEMPPIWQTYRGPIIGFLVVCLLIVTGVLTHFLTPYGAFGVPAMIEALSYEAPPPPPAAPPPPPPKLANLPEIEGLIRTHTYESFRSAIATLEQAGPTVPANALALAKARVLASLAYGIEAFPVEPARRAVAALGAIDAQAGPEAAELDKLKSRAGLAVLEGSVTTALPELEKAARSHPDNVEIALILGAALESEARAEAALIAYDRGIVADPAFAPTYRRIGRLVESLGGPHAPAHAARWFEKALAAQPKDARSALDAARLYGAASRAGARRRALEAAARAASEGLLPDHRAAALVTTVQAFDQLGRIDEVADLAEEAARLAPGDARAVALAAVAAAAVGDAKQAAARLDPVVAREPDNATVLVARARAHMAANDVAKALLDLERARRSKAPGDAEMWVARFNRKLGKFEDAEAALRVAARDPADAAPHVELARLALAEGNVDEAHAEAKAAVTAEPDVAEAHIELGRTLTARGQLDEAQAAFERAVELDDEHVEARLGLANALRDRALRSREPTRAQALGRSIPMYLRLLVDDPKNPTVLFEYGRVLEMQGDFTGALRLYEQAAALDASDVRPHLKMVAAQLQKSPPDLAQAKTSLKTAQSIELSSGRRSAEVRSWEAQIALAEGKAREAVRAMRKATELEPENARYHLILGRALERSNSLYEAISAYQRAVALNSRLAEAHRALGRAAIERHRFEEARGHFAKYRQFAPEDASVWADIGESFSRQNKDDEALDAFRKALDADRTDARSLVQIGLIESRRGRERDAQRRFRAATETQPEYAESWCLLGISLGQVRITRPAKEALERCLDLPGGPRDLVDTATQMLDRD